MHLVAHLPRVPSRASSLDPALPLVLQVQPVKFILVSFPAIAFDFVFASALVAWIVDSSGDGLGDLMRVSHQARLVIRVERLGHRLEILCARLPVPILPEAVWIVLVEGVQIVGLDHMSRHRRRDVRAEVIFNLDGDSLLSRLRALEILCEETEGMDTFMRELILLQDFHGPFVLIGHLARLVDDVHYALLGWGETAASASVERCQRLAISVSTSRLVKE